MDSGVARGVAASSAGGERSRETKVLRVRASSMGDLRGSLGRVPATDEGKEEEEEEEEEIGSDPKEVMISTHS